MLHTSQVVVLKAKYLHEDIMTWLTMNILSAHSQTLSDHAVRSQSTANYGMERGSVTRNGTAVTLSDE